MHTAVFLILAGLFCARAAPPPGLRAPDYCQTIGSALPSECRCTDAKAGFVLQCKVDLLDIDEVGLEAKFLPCASPATATLVVTNEKPRINYTIANVTAGVTNEIAVPGLVLGIPVIGDVQVELAVELDGNAEHLEIHLGLDACGEILGRKECGEDIAPQLPVWLLKGAWDFGQSCELQRAALAAQSRAVM